jgi:hypothetical protein
LKVVTARRERAVTGHRGLRAGRLAGACRKATQKKKTFEVDHMDESVYQVVIGHGSVQDRGRSTPTDGWDYKCLENGWQIV